MKTSITPALCFLLFFSCQKENGSLKKEPALNLTARQQEELADLKNKLKNETFQLEKSAIGVSPASEDNYMDSYGLNFQQALLHTNELNSIYDNHLSPEQAFEKWSGDLHNSYQEGLDNMPLKPDENITFSFYAETIFHLFLDDFESSVNVNQLIAHAKIFEHFIAKNESLNPAEKDALLTEISILKYSMYSVYEFGVTLNGISNSQKISKSKLWDCIGKKVRQIHQELGNTAGYFYCLAFGDLIIANCVTYLLING